ncbi:MAG: ABC transporter ATP-binding protein [Beijerinckiaceae bacterium]
MSAASTGTSLSAGQKVALSVDNVSLSFGGVRAINEASLTVTESKLTALVGPNGAGKTTLFNVIAGMFRPERGSILFQGSSIAGLSPEAITRRGLIRTFQIARGLPKMTVFEHLMLYGQDQPGENLTMHFMNFDSVKRHEERLAESALSHAARLKLSHVINNQVTALSGGQKKLLEIARVLMAEPKMILFDEPAAGVNPSLAEEIGDHLRGLVAEGRTVLLIEHDMALVERIADHVIVMAEGRKLTEGSFNDIRENDAVQRAYLGARSTSTSVAAPV